MSTAPRSVSLCVVLLAALSLSALPPAAAQIPQAPQAEIHPVPGWLGTGFGNSVAPAESAAGLTAEETTVRYRIRLDLRAAGAVERARRAGLADAAPDRDRYEISRETVGALVAAGFQAEVLGGATLHRFSGFPGSPLAGPETGESEPRPAGILATPGSFYLSSGTVDDYIPDAGWAWRWVQVGAGAAAPPGSVTTRLDYRLRVHNDFSPSDIWCSDYRIFLSSTARGGAVPHWLVYDNRGSQTDGGWDDDTDDDSDIYLNLRSTTHFNGENPNQQWYVYIEDTAGQDWGYLQYIEFQVLWESPDPVDLQALDVYLRTQSGDQGTRVDSPAAGQALYPHFRFDLDGSSSLNGTIWRIQLDGATTLCSFTGPLGPGAWVGSCLSPWTVTAGLHNLNGRADPNGSFSEANEGNNDANRNYSIGGTPDIRVEPLTLNFTSSALAAESAAGEETGEIASAGAAAWTPKSEVLPRLMARAAEQGKVRILVRLDVPFVPEGRLSSAAAEDQQRTLRSAQDDLLTRLSALSPATPARLVARYQYVPYVALEVDGDTLAALGKMASVTAIEEDVPVPPTLASSIPVIGADAAWAAGYTGSGQTVAILDTGVDKTHSFFTTGGAKVVSEACYSTTGSISTSVCPGGVSSSTASGSGVNCSTSVDGCDHGTHVAGIAAGNNGGSNIGVARAASVIAIQVFSRFDSSTYCDFPPCVLTWSSDQIKGLERVYALRNTFNIAAANMSLGGGQYFSRSSCDASNGGVKAAIDTLRSVGIATVIASGNDGFTTSMGAPGCISSAISVGATTDSDAVASFSNMASFLDLQAPGVSITSSVPGGGTSAFNGTSMATPHVAGAWAILKQVKPTASVTEILNALRTTGTLVDDNRSGGTVDDIPRINVDDAAAALGGGGQSFTIFNDGNATLTVTSLQLQPAAAWITWSPAAPFDIAPGGSRQVSVQVNFAGAPPGQSTYRLLVSSNDAGESPYPNGVFLVVNKPAPCYALTRTRTGSGADPVAIPANSSGCPSGQFYAGSSIALTASPAGGWAVGSWSGTNNNGSTATSNTVTMPAAARTVTVNYIQQAAVASDFFTVAPCRVIDTRTGTPLASTVARNFAVASACGVPSNAKAVAVNVTAFVGSGSGNIRLYPAGTSLPSTSVINFPAGVVRANNAIVPLGSGAITAYASVGGAGTVHLIVDVVGYFQ